MTIFLVDPSAQTLEEVSRIVAGIFPDGDVQTFQSSLDALSAAP